jgi:uncharacterized damage-inducible protein DinB
MKNTPFLHFYLRDLDKVIAEIEAFSTDEALWQTHGEVTNSAGNLALHLAGNLQHFIGALMGGTGYVRDRDREFSAKNLTKTEVIAELRIARSVVEKILPHITEEKWSQTIPGNHHFGPDGTLLHGLLHIMAHLSYHLGQINYLRRGLAKMPANESHA